MRHAGVEALVVREQTLADAAAAGELSLAAGSEILAAFRVNAITSGYLFEHLRPEHVEPARTYVFVGQRNRQQVAERLRAVFGDAAVTEPGRQRWSADYRVIAVAAPRPAVAAVVIEPPAVPAWLDDAVQPPLLETAPGRFVGYGPPLWWILAGAPALPETRRREEQLWLLPDHQPGWRMVWPGEGRTGVTMPGEWQPRAALVPVAEWPARAVRLAGYEQVRLAWLRPDPAYSLAQTAAFIRQGRAALAAAGFAESEERCSHSGGHELRLPALLAVLGIMFPALVLLLQAVANDARVKVAIIAGVGLAAGCVVLAGMPLAPVIGLVLIMLLAPPALAGACAPPPAINVPGGRGTLLLIGRTLLAVLLTLAAGLVMQMTDSGLTEVALAEHRALLAGAALAGVLLSALLCLKEPLAALRGWLRRPLTGGAFVAGCGFVLAAPAFAARFALQPPHAVTIVVIGLGITALAWHYLALFINRRAAACWLALPAGLGLVTLLSLFLQPQALPWLVWRQVAVALAPGLAILPLTMLLAVGWLGLNAKWRDIDLQ
ncbi:MAG TPA: hypothetical protein PKM88_14515 [bacterium]|nr:hypothetical protein [bacterium]